MIRYKWYVMTISAGRVVYSPPLTSEEDVYNLVRMISSADCSISTVVFTVEV